VLSEPLVDVDLIRMFLIRWIIETGDPIEIVAKGFDLEAVLLDDLLGRRVRYLPKQQVAELAARLGLETR